MRFDKHVSRREALVYDGLELVHSLRRFFSRSGQRRTVVFVSGNFNVLHPGHIRLLKFAAECGDLLVVGINRDGADTQFPLALRLEGVRSIGLVDACVVTGSDIVEVLQALRPDVVVKGHEHEGRYNVESSVVRSYGGKIIFSSGGPQFSAIDHLTHDAAERRLPGLIQPVAFLERHQISPERATSAIQSFSKLKIVVIGDLIVDEYIDCAALGMSREDPTLVVSPQNSRMFAGGAAIVAMHARSLGAHVSYVGVCGADSCADFVRSRLEAVGVEGYLVPDASRPTTLKQRFRASGKTLLRVSHVRQHAVDQEISARLLEAARSALVGANLLIFSDFNYGCLPQRLVDDLVGFCSSQAIPMVADSQASSQLSDVSRFSGMLLMTPTEYEARLATEDKDAGLVSLAEALLTKSSAENLFITLGAEGMFVLGKRGRDSRLESDQLPALNSAPQDVSGAGDCLLACASMALVAGCSIWEAAYLGSLAAAIQVGKVGNVPVTVDEIVRGALQ
jgi:rfaE bifunctional protein kinase chain/domain